MKNIINRIFICFMFTITLIACSDPSEDLIVEELSIQEKVQILEGSEWLLAGFEDRVMHTFVDGEEFTFYGSDNVFGEAIPGTKEYTITGDLLTIDFNFGNIFTYEVKVSCDNNIVEWFKDGELNKTLYRRGSNYQECL